MVYLVDLSCSVLLPTLIYHEVKRRDPRITTANEHWQRTMLFLTIMASFRLTVQVIWLWWVWT